MKKLTLRNNMSSLILPGHKSNHFRYQMNFTAVFVCHVTGSKIAFRYVTLHFGHVIDGDSQMKNKRFSCRRTALRTDARTDEITTQPTTF